MDESPANLSNLSLDEPPETAEEPEPEHAKVQLLDLSKKPETPKAAVPPQLQSYLPLVGHYPHTEDNFAPIEEVTLTETPVDCAEGAVRRSSRARKLRVALEPNDDSGDSPHSSRSNWSDEERLARRSSAARRVRPRPRGRPRKSKKSK